MTTPVLGRLEQVDLRRVWISESSGFTPWLARPENLKLLGETIGIDLELVAREKDVGPFRADILCRDVEREDALILIENQLEATDHRHLGQLMTYAAGSRPRRSSGSPPRSGRSTGPPSTGSTPSRPRGSTSSDWRSSSGGSGTPRRRGHPANSAAKAEDVEQRPESL